jgi:hypothetical protein
VNDANVMAPSAVVTKMLCTPAKWMMKLTDMPSAWMKSSHPQPSAFDRLGGGIGLDQVAARDVPAGKIDGPALLLALAGN